MKLGKIKSYYLDELVTVYCGDCRKVLKELPEKSVYCCVTSPPYWSLRDYGLEPLVWGGDEKCKHEWKEKSYQRRSNDGGKAERKQTTNVGAIGRDKPIFHATCFKCNAWHGSLGLEPNPEMYVQHLVEIFREVRRVLRDDGTLWLNLGDSYAGSWGNYAPGGIKGKQRPQTKGGRRYERKAYDSTTFLPPTAGIKRRSNRKTNHRNNSVYNDNGFGINHFDFFLLKPKDLIGIPWMAAFALRADGWYLRSDIIWAKPNPMPESVKDRPTKAHEYIFLLSKNQKYYYDTDAIKEESQEIISGGIKRGRRRYQVLIHQGDSGLNNYGERFARCNPLGRNKRSVWTIPTQPFPKAHFAVYPPKLIEPCILAGCSKSGIVFDPFMGAGTTCVVSKRLNRKSIGIEINPDYCEMAVKWIKKTNSQLGLF